MTQILITGATGHLGAALAGAVIERTNWGVVALERLPQAGAPDRKAHLPAGRIRRLYHDFRAPLSDALLKEAGEVAYIVHAGAEVHALRSLENPALFVQSNVIGTFNVLEAARKLQPKSFLYVSSAEVLGPAPEDRRCGEDDTLCPANPYAAAKAAGEMLVRSYQRSFGVPAQIVRTMNLFGERQQASKFIPMVLVRLLENKTIPIHVGPDGRSGSRQWMYVGAFADALLYLLQHGTPGQVYHAAGEEKTNAEIVALLADCLGVAANTESVDVSVHFPAHTLRYAISGERLAGLGWQQPVGFSEALMQTAFWTVAHPEWM